MAMLCLGFNTYLKAQYIVNGKEIDTTFNTKMNFIFGNLDKSHVPFGLLKDYAMEFTNLQAYDGSNMADSTLLNKALLSEIYNTLYTAIVTPAASAALPNPGITDSIWYNKRRPGQVALSGLYFKYAYLDANALNTNKIVVNNGQYFDSYISGVYQNPYLTTQTIGFAPATEVYMGKSFNILLADSLWLSNSKNQVDHIEIDAGDGLGYRTLTPNVQLLINYADTGLKVWNFKLYLTDNSVLQSHSRLQVIADDYGQNDMANYINSASGTSGFPSFPSFPASGPGSGVVPARPTPGATYRFYNVTSQDTYLGIPGKGYVTLKLAPGHIGIQKPLIIMEGFDDGKLTTPDNPTGKYSLTNFNNSITFGKSGNLEALLTGSTQSYDIIFVDYDDGTDYIQRNACMLKEVIRWVNNQKQLSGSTEHNVVLGLSMGGLVSRYALKTMENAGENHDTRLFICHDSPQQGANVPTGLQFAVNHFTNLYLRSGVGFLAYHLFGIMPALFRTGSRPASLQMTLNYIDPNDNLNNSVHNAWQTELTNLGYPANSRNVVISNGSECAKLQDVTQGGELFLVDGEVKTSLLTELLIGTSNVFTGLAVATGQPALLLGILPGSNKLNLHFQASAANTMGGNQVYNGNMTFTKKLLWLLPITVTMTSRSRNAPSVLNYDYFPGGISHSDPINSTSANTWFYNYNITIHGPVDFCFIPTPSALDISASPTNLVQGDYLTPYSEGTPPVAPKSTPFVNFVTAFNGGSSNNEDHISYETRNGNWLYAELTATTATPTGTLLSACNIFCNPIQITGNDFACDGTPQTVSVPNSPGIDYQWSSTSNLQLISGQGTSSLQFQTVTGAQGQGTITLKYGNAGCGYTTITKVVNVGTPICQTTNGFYKRFHDNVGNFAIFSVPEQPGCSYSWVVIGLNTSTNASTTYHGTGKEIVIQSPDCGYDFWATAVTVTNSCGAKVMGQSFTFDCNSGTAMTANTYSSAHYCIDPAVMGPKAYLPTPSLTTSEPSFYPNPGNQSVTITTRNSPTANLTAAPFSYKIYDELGKVIKSGQSNGEDALVVTSDLISKTYFLHISVGDKLYKKQLIIQH